MKFVFKHILSLSFDNDDNDSDNDDDDAHRVALQLGQGGRAAGGALAWLAVVTHHNILPRYVMLRGGYSGGLFLLLRCVVHVTLLHYHCSPQTVSL